MERLSKVIELVKESNFKDANEICFDALYSKIEEKLNEKTTTAKEGLDSVDKKELKGKHKDRDDKDIDNDGDVDSSDKYLHKRRKAISKAVSNDEGAEMDIAKEKENMAGSQEKIRDLAIKLKKEKSRKRNEA
jgi:hypothetical protein